MAVMPAKKSTSATKKHWRHRLSWKWVLASLGGISAVYVALVATGHGPVTASQGMYYCPAEKTACANGHCDDMPMCKDGKCSASCPGNCHMKPA